MDQRRERASFDIVFALVVVVEIPRSGVGTAWRELPVTDELQGAVVNSQASATKFDDLAVLWLFFEHLRVEILGGRRWSFSHLFCTNSRTSFSFAPSFRFPTYTTAFFFPVGLLPATRVQSSSSSSSSLIGNGWFGILDGPDDNSFLGAADFVGSEFIRLCFFF